jgi:hypothetical protein
VLLTITTTRAPAADLGYLLHKHPDRVQAFTVPAGTAHVFYPQASAERCTAALLLEVDPVGLVRDEVRGREYLRISYGPDYTEPAHLARLRQRGLSHKRSLALREYALGLEALDRVARGEPLWRVHECVFAVLALESEPVDPRL